LDVYLKILKVEYYNIYNNDDSGGENDFMMVLIWCHGSGGCDNGGCNGSCNA
jgi:hypothetical protein